MDPNQNSFSPTPPAGQPPIQPSGVGPVNAGQPAPSPSAGVEPAINGQIPVQPSAPLSPVMPHVPATGEAHTVPPGGGLQAGLNYSEVMPTAPAPPEPVIAPAPSPVTPPLGVELPAKQKQSKNNKIIMIAGGALIVLLLIMLAVFGYKAFINQGHLDKSFAAGKEEGKAEQFEADSDKIKDVTENPYRTYKAPEVSGAFEIVFPKNWNLNVTPAGEGELSVLFNPDFVDTKIGEYAMRVYYKPVLFKKIESDYKKMVESSNGTLKSEDITVSDLKGYRIYGKFNKKDKENKTHVILPVRDKTVIIQTDNNKVYEADFNKVLAASKIY